MNYLFLIDEHVPTHSANGICMDKVMTELVRNNHEVYCISFARKLMTPMPYSCFYISEKPWKKITNYFASNKRRVGKFVFNCLRGLYWIKRIALLFIWPVNSISSIINYYTKSFKVINEYKINKLIAVSYPGETLLAAKLIKKTFQDRVQVLIFPLDVTTEGRTGGLLFERKLSRIGGRHLLNSCLETVDNILVLENATSHFLACLKQELHQKIKYCGIPLICCETECVDGIRANAENGIFQGERTINCVFAGKLLHDLRNPIPLLDLLEMCRIDGIDTISFHLFGEADDRIKKAWTDRYKHVRIVEHGWVEERVLDDVLISADVLINIGNTYSHLIPSKLFKYMSLRKPILQLSFVPDDPCIFYLKKYGSSFILSPSCSSSDLNALIGFLTNRKQFVGSLCDLFPQCTPKYMAHLLEEP